jgi:hypothetical protein
MQLTSSDTGQNLVRIKSLVKAFCAVELLDYNAAAKPVQANY